jgi:hypothetical protein
MLNTMQRIELERKVSGILNRPIVLTDDGSGARSGHKYAAPLMTDSGHWFSPFVENWSVYCSVDVLERDPHATHWAIVLVKYNHSELAGRGSNGVSFNLFLHKCGQWLTRDEIAARLEQE